MIIQLFSVVVFYPIKRRTYVMQIKWDISCKFYHAVSYTCRTQYMFTFAIIPLLLQFWIQFKAWDRRKEILLQAVVWHQPLPFTWLSIIIISVAAVSVLCHSFHSEMGCMLFSLQSGWDFVTVSTSRLYYGQKWHGDFWDQVINVFLFCLAHWILVLKAISCWK